MICFHYRLQVLDNDHPDLHHQSPHNTAKTIKEKNKLIHSVSEHTESQTQLYEDIDTLLQKMEIQNGTRSKYPSAAPPVPSRPPPVSPRKNKLIHSVSEHTESQTELYEDLDTLLKEMEIQELDILMTWWAKVDKWEELSMYYQSEEEETKVFTTKVHRVNMGMRLYEVLLVHHGKILMNHITELRCIADNLDKMGKKTKIASITGGATGAAGGVAAVVGLALAPITFGASLVVSAIGAGVAAAGGVTGASAAISNKVSSTQDRKRVEKILHDCKSKIKDIEGCLEFIHTGMKLLREHDSSTLKGVDEDALRVAMVAEEFGGAKGAVSECSGIVQSFESAMDSYYAKEDSERLKKGSEKNFAQRIREVAEKLKESLDELIRIKNVLRSAASKV
ncbi:apolipoprotein L6-like [Chanos chanos]|uniref:Apolipoprotein L6-like n=1 Tax=Chanos chanos TaxID=29144 RepID=A0A6J2W393_CHACN|nr:apolipoprotein L6-like [Chanos chanos]